MSELDILTKIKTDGICGIIRKVTSDQAINITEALLKGGVSVVEVAFNTPNAATIITELKRQFGSQLTVGAGTVLDTETARTAILAGADFILSPTLHTDVIRMCKKYNVLAVPGVYTPTEIIQAWEAGAHIVKIFPAVTMTPAFISQVKGPLDQIDIMAVGGITEENTEAFVRAGASCVGIGSEIAGLKLVKNDSYERITEKAVAFREIIQRAKQS